MLRCSLKFNPQSVILYQQYALWVKMSNTVNPAIFARNFIFSNSVKRHICGVKNSRQGHDLPISVYERVISAFREDFIFTKLRIHNKV